MREPNLKHYLLGLLPEQERTQLELQLLSDDEAYQQFLLAEDELIEAYLQAELSVAERERFERIFLAHPERQQKLNLTKALITKANSPVNSEEPTSRASVTPNWWAGFWPLDWKLAATAAMALLAIIIVIWVVRQKSVSPETPIIAAAPRTSGTPQAAPVGTKTLSVELGSGKTMAIGTKLEEIEIAPEIGEVHLQLWLRKDQWDTYKVILQPYDLPAKELTGEYKRQTAKGLSYLDVRIPVTDLQAREFTLKLEGVNNAGERVRADHYSFKIRRH